MNNFDAVASFYDPLAKLVYGNQIRNAQVHFLSTIPENAQILVIGGGTGWILSEILQNVPGCKITYVEASDKMLQKSRKSVKDNHPQVLFIHGTENDLPNHSTFDTIITPFILDLFRQDTLLKMMQKLTGHLRQEGTWLFTDFTSRDKRWQRLLMKSMYLFFGWMSKVEARQKPDFDAAFGQLEFTLTANRFFYRNMIEARLYKRVQ